MTTQAFWSSLGAVKAPLAPPVPPVRRPGAFSIPAMSAGKSDALVTLLAQIAARSLSSATGAPAASFAPTGSLSGR